MYNANATIDEILQKVASTRSSDVVDWSKRRVTENKGFLSIIDLINLKLSNGEELHILLKGVLDDSVENRPDFYVDLSRDSFRREIRFYQDIYPDLLGIIRERNLPNIFPELFFAGEMNDGSVVIVLEDLNHTGYVMPEVTSMVTEKELQPILMSIAVFATSTIALQVKHGKGISELYPFVPISYDEQIIDLMSKEMDNFLDHLKGNVKNWEKYIKIIDELKLATTHDVSVEFNGVKYGFLCHGDLWLHNVFLNKDQCKLIDWPFLSISNISVDLSVFVITSIIANERDAAELTRKYFDRVKGIVEDMAGKDQLLQKITSLLLEDSMKPENFKSSLLRGVKMIIASWSSWIQLPEPVWRGTISIVCSFFDYAMNH